MLEAKTLDRVVSIVVTLATVVAASVLVEGRTGRRQDRGLPQASIEFIKDWRAEVAKAGVSLSKEDRPVSIAVFTDFECPFCRQMDSILTQLDHQYPGKIGRTLIHYPLSMHRNAKPAARAFECAAAQGRGAEMNAALYAGQAAFDDRAWSRFAMEANVSDSLQFERCIGDDSAHGRISAGVALGKRLAVLGTPTVMVNGWLLKPTEPETLIDAVEAAVAGKSPKPKGQ